MNFTKPLAAASLALGFVASTLTLAAEVITLNIATPGFGQSQVLAWSWGASNSGSSQAGGGAGAGKANFQDLSLTRLTDAQSPNFLKRVALGQFLPEVILQDGSLRITLNEVLVTSLSTGGASAKKEPLTENITLNFAKFKYQVNGIEFAFDIRANATQ